MSFAIKNKYELPPKRTFPELHESTRPEDYDVNFCFPIRELSTSRVTLVPFIPSLHADDYMKFMQEGDAKATFKGLNWGPFESKEEFLQYVEFQRSSPTMILFAVLDTTSDAPRFAGVVNYWLANLRTLSVELGSVMTTLAYRRTHVTTHAAGLLIAYALTPPGVTSKLLGGGSQGGLGLRRIQWTAYPYNQPSIKCALRLGFTEEGVLRNGYEKPADPTKGKHDEGNADLTRGREWSMEPCYDEGGDRTERGFAQDCWLASITCRDWDEGVEGRLTEQMNRTK